MNIKTVERYKYLDATLNANLDFLESAQELAEPGDRAPWGLFSKFKVHKNIGYHTNYTVPEKAARYFMGVNSKTPIHMLTGDMGWLTMKVRIFLEFIKYYNWLITMDHSRLTYKVVENDLQNIFN